MYVARVALIDLEWIYDETQEGLQEMTGPFTMGNRPACTVALHSSILLKYSSDPLMLI